MLVFGIYVLHLPNNFKTDEKHKLPAKPACTAS